MSAIAKLLIANRGEIAIRIARAAGEMGIATVAIHSSDDARSLHVRAADEVVALPGEGPAGYLDIAEVVNVALATGCDAIHPGYGFLSENADFARACADAGIIFVGPTPEALLRFGDKLSAKRLAASVGVPVLAGIENGDVAAARALVASGPVMVKAVAGGGGRGIRLVRDADEIDAAIAACSAEAEAAFGSGAVIVERFVEHARHIEVQVLGDSGGAVVALGTRDCTLQRRNQKMVEIAPAPLLDPALSARMVAAATKLIGAAPYQGLATVEFLVDCDVVPDAPDAFAFIEVNPRIQVEHTVTEAVYGVDLVKAGLRIAAGATLTDLGLDHAREPQGVAIQLRINAESIDAEGRIRPAASPITAYDAPGGPGIRVDGAGYAGYAVNPRFDSLLAKLIVHGDDFPAATHRARRALADFRIGGADSNIALLATVLDRPEFAGAAIDTRWLERVLPELLATEVATARHFEPVAASAGSAHHAAPAGTSAVGAPLTGTVISVGVVAGDIVRPGQQVAVMEALKMQHLVTGSVAGIVRAIVAKPGEVLSEGVALLFVEPADVGESEVTNEITIDLDARRADLAELEDRIALTLDKHRPAAVAKRRRTGQRTARENLGDLFDGGSFIEYGGLAIASGRHGTTEELMKATPGDGIVTGIGTVNGGEFGEEAAKCAALAYDFTVIAGTQGRINHQKTDRIIDIAGDLEIPLVFYTEGGGGRPGDGSVGRGSTGLAGVSFEHFAALSGKIPRIGVTSGRCFAGNAVFLGCCDIIIATERSNIGLGGPAMIEGGGLGVYTPDEVGPIDVMWANGVVDVRAADEAAATAAARQILGYFQGRVATADYADQRLLRHVVPEDRLRVFDIRKAIELIADTGSWTEMRGGFGHGMITGFLRIDGRSMGVIANDCRYLSGAMDAEGCDKAAHFMQICDAFGIPILSLCDTPGFMVGPEAEKTGTVRKGGRMFVVAASLSVPMFTIVIRKGYGLGAMAMAGGSLHASTFTIAWPSGEFGGMGLEGAVRLGHRRELEEIADPKAREARFQALVAELYANGKAVAVAQFIDIDAVIDPADTRAWLARGLSSAPATRGSRRYIDAW
jgi:acetyl/propionyl-CoA carboxylase alpha subunit